MLFFLTKNVNMKNLKAIILIITLIVCTKFSFSQNKTNSLAECIEYAKQHNITVKQQSINADIQNNNYKQSKWNLLPNLNAGSDYTLSFGRVVNPYTNEFTETDAKSMNFYANSSIVLFQGFYKQHLIKKNKYNYLAANQTTEKIKNDIALNIAAAYLQILFNTELLQIAEQQTETTKLQQERIKKLTVAGKIPESELSDIEAQLANEEFQQTQAENNLKDAYLVLYQLMDIRNEDAFKITTSEFTEPNLNIKYTPEDLFQISKTLPQIKIAMYQTKSAEEDIAIAKSAYYPQISLNASYATGFSDARKLFQYGDTVINPIGFTNNNEQIVYSAMPTYKEVPYEFKDQLKDNRNQNISFRLTVPIFNQRQTKTRHENAILYAQQAQLNMKTVENNLYKEIQNAYSQAIAARAQYISSKKAADANQKAFQNTENRFKLNMTDAASYKQAKIQLQNAKSKFLQSKYEFIFRKKILDFYAGQNLY